MNFDQKRFKIQKSPIAEQGLFANIPFRAGETLFKVHGKIIQHSYEPTFAPNLPNGLGVGIEKWIDPDPNSPWIYANHSCQPNMGFQGNTQLVAIRAIQSNEELTVDYAMTEADPYWAMQCICQSEKCRKIIRSFQFLPAELRKEYKTFIPTWMRQFVIV